MVFPLWDHQVLSLFTYNRQLDGQKDGHLRWEFPPPHPGMNQESFPASSAYSTVRYPPGEELHYDFPEAVHCLLVSPFQCKSSSHSICPQTTSNTYAFRRSGRRSLFLRTPHLQIPRTLLLCVSKLGTLFCQTEYVNDNPMPIYSSPLECE